MTTTAAPVDREFHKPKFYHELTGKSVDWIRARINDGSLRAFDFSEATRPDWYIHESDWAAFLETKSNAPPSPKPRRGKRQVNVREFF